MEARQARQMGQGVPQNQQHPGTRSPLPEVGKSIAAQFLQEHEETKEALRAAEDHIRELRSNCNDLLRENEGLRERLATAESRVMFLQGYSTEIMTSLENIELTTTSLIRSALDRASKSGLARARGAPPPVTIEPAAADPIEPALAITTPTPPDAPKPVLGGVIGRAMPMPEFLR